MRAACLLLTFVSAARAETKRWDVLQTNGDHTYPPTNVPLEPAKPPPLFQVNLVPPDEEGGRPKFEVTLGPPKIRTSSPNGKYAMSPWESIQPEYEWCPQPPCSNKITPSGPLVSPAMTTKPCEGYDPCRPHEIPASCVLERPCVVKPDQDLLLDKVTGGQGMRSPGDAMSVMGSGDTPASQFGIPSVDMGVNYPSTPAAPAQPGTMSRNAYIPPGMMSGNGMGFEPRGPMIRGGSMGPMGGSGAVARGMYPGSGSMVQGNSLMFQGPGPSFQQRTIPVSNSRLTDDTDPRDDGVKTGSRTPVISFCDVMEETLGCCGNNKCEYPEDSSNCVADCGNNMVQDLEAMNQPPVDKMKNQKTSYEKQKQSKSPKISESNSLAPLPSDYGEEDGEDERMDSHQTKSYQNDAAETKQLVHDVLEGAVAQLDGISDANPTVDDDGANMRFRGNIVIKPSDNVFTTTAVSKGATPQGTTGSTKKNVIFASVQEHANVKNKKRAHNGNNFYVFAHHSFSSHDVHK